MGYIFDALNQFNDGQEPDKASNPETGNPTYASDARPLTPRQDQQSPANAYESAPVDHQPEPQNDIDPAAGPFKIESANSMIDTDSITADERLVSITSPASMTAEEYRSIRTGILAKWQHKRHLVHTITSATPQEGKTITTLNLGFSFAELRNRRTLVLEADLRLPLFEKMMSLPKSGGLVGLLEGRTDLTSSIHRFADDRLHMITAGRRINNARAGQLLSSTAMISLMKKLRSSYDHIIIDTPPVIELADAGILGSISNEVLLIARLNQTPRALIEQAIRVLTSYNAPVGGLIATDQQRPHRRYYYKYGYKYGNSYGYNGQHDASKAA